VVIALVRGFGMPGPPSLTDTLEISCECIGNLCLLVMLAMRLDVMILNWLVSSKVIGYK
jgi:hypothetical protein